MPNPHSKHKDLFFIAPEYGRVIPETHLKGTLKLKAPEQNVSIISSLGIWTLVFFRTPEKLAFSGAAWCRIGKNYSLYNCMILYAYTDYTVYIIISELRPSILGFQDRKVQKRRCCFQALPVVWKCTSAFVSMCRAVPKTASRQIWYNT